MINRPTDKEKVDRYVGQIERIRKQLHRLSESMAMQLDTVTEVYEERRLRKMLNRVIRGLNTLELEE